MDLKEIGVNTRNWVDSAQDRDYWRYAVLIDSLHYARTCSTYLSNYEPEHYSQSHRDRQALKMMHMTSKGFC